jgi:tyrosine-protein phosphatase SIW14
LARRSSFFSFLFIHSFSHRAFSEPAFFSHRVAVALTERSNMRRLFTALVLFALLAPCGSPAQSGSPQPEKVVRSAYGERLKLPGLPNGGRVTDVLFRGAQPRAEGFEQLKKLGITTIVDLRGEDPAKREWERQQAETVGIRFVSIPVSGWSPPSNEQVAQFLSLFREDRREKVFIHCRFGDDRTGVFVATYRMALEGWPAEQAVNEMYFFGFNGFWHPSMKAFIRDFPARLKTAPALAALPVAQPAASPN